MFTYPYVYTAWIHWCTFRFIKEYTKRLKIVMNFLIPCNNVIQKTICSWKLFLKNGASAFVVYNIVHIHNVVHMHDIICNTRYCCPIQWSFEGDSKVLNFMSLIFHLSNNMSDKQNGKSWRDLYCCVSEVHWHGFNQHFNHAFFSYTQTVFN